MNQKILWIATGFAAVLIVVGAVWIARQRVAEGPAVSSPETTLIQQSAIRPASSVTPAPVEETGGPGAPIVYNEVAVDLSRIAGTLSMSSADIPAAAPGQLPRYPLELTCYRRNSSPALSWSGAPGNTKSYALVLERRARNEKASWSWIMFNIPASTSNIPGKITAEALTAEQGLFGANAYGNQAYTGPCDPRGIFPYVLRLFALDTMLPLSAGATLDDIVPAMSGHIVDAAEIPAEHYLRM